MKRRLDIAIIGAGRVGLTLARALARSGHEVALLSRTARHFPDLPRPAQTDWQQPLGEAAIILLAVPDDAVSAVSDRIAAMRVVGDSHVVLHTSGLLDRSALAALVPSSAALGSFHPLQSFARPSDDPEFLAGVTAVLEGDEAAVAAGGELAASLGMTPMTITAADKPRYHAAAVFASNYLVVLGDIVARLGKLEKGLEPFLPLMRTTLANLEGVDPAEALTGPIARGDVGTVRAHLAVLEGEERELYLALGREALRIAAPRLGRDRVAEFRKVLG